MLADRMVQLDHMTRGRAMFGVGPGALVHDALKIGIDPGDQRRMMNEALEIRHTTVSVEGSAILGKICLWNCIVLRTRRGHGQTGRLSIQV
jgi:hypothetical protein